MSSKKQIECITRLDMLAGSISNILQFLVEEKLVDSSLLLKVKSSPDKAKDLQRILSELSNADKLLLLSYDWEILPVERIRIHIVTSRSNKTFEHGY